MPTTLTDEDWTTLLKRIKAGKCTPFLGSGVCAGVLPLGGEIARKWAKEYNYPEKDCSDLVRIAQYVAVKYDSMFPKDEIIELFNNLKEPDFKNEEEPHRILSELPLPVFLTTNYDNFMARALESNGKKPEKELCHWNKQLKDRPSVFDTDYEPSASQPVVYHLHGNLDITESLVLTEDDYLDFLVNISNDSSLLPSRIQQALTGASLMFIGYKLEDWDFRVLFRGLVTNKESSLRRISITVQLPPDEEGLRDYLGDYFSKKEMKVYWGTAREFLKELKTRWDKFNHDE